jgi:hypothetical protein
VRKAKRFIRKKSWDQSLALLWTEQLCHICVEKSDMFYGVYILLKHQLFGRNSTGKEKKEMCLG